MDKKEIKETLNKKLMEYEKPISAGVLVLCIKTNRILLLLRSSGGTGGNTWNLVSGGIDEGESVIEGLKREVNEEMSIDPNIIKYKFINIEDSPDSPFDFHYYEGLVVNEFTPTLCDENVDWGWYDKDDLPSPLYPNIDKKIKEI